MDTEVLPGVETAADPDALVGRNLAGKFVLEKKLGEGAMGAVYRASQTALEKVVAIKVMNADIARDPMFAARFHREAKAASRLDHPNSIRILDYGQDPDGLLYIAMEYLDGRDLAHILVSDWPIPSARIVDLLSQALGAIAVAHDLGITHRDLKPENIMVLRRSTDDGVGIDVVKVCDFGIAKLVDSDDAPNGPLSGAGAGQGRGKLTTAGLVIGTPAYMSPEQGRGEPIDGRSDLYSMGVILYQMITGQLPFDAPSALGIVLKHQSDLPAPPSSVRPGVDAHLEAVCLKALAKAPAHRYQNARELRAALRGGVDGGVSPHSIELRPPPSRDGPEPEVVFAPTELQLAAVPTTQPVVLSPATSTGVPTPARPRTALAAGVGLLVLACSVAGWQLSHDRPVGRPEIATPPTPPERAPASHVAANGEELGKNEAVSVHTTVGEKPTEAEHEERKGVTTAHVAGAPVLENHKAGVTSKPVLVNETVSVGRAVTVPEPTTAPSPPPPPPPPPVAPAVAPPPEVPAVPAGPRFDPATATVQFGVPRVESMAANGVTSLMGHLKGDIVRCYTRDLSTLSALSGPLEGSGSLHIETEDGIIGKASAQVPVGGRVGPCIEAAVSGQRVSNADTGPARADIPLEFKAK